MRRYNDFFVTCCKNKQRHVFLQGGRRSGKTFSTFKWLNLMCSTLSGQKIMVVCYQFPQLQKTMEDFTNAIGETISGNIITGYTAKTAGETLWNFSYFDRPTKAQGTQCDFLFINEAVNVPRNIAEVLMQGTRKQCYYNYNPTKKFWGNDYFTGDNLLCTTFKDNPYLPDEQVQEFENLRIRAERPNATRYERYMFDVYYDGKFGNAAGSVFGHVEHISFEEYKQIQALEAIGIDFGFATDGDPTTVIGVKIKDKKIYVHQYIYERGLTSDEELAKRLLNNGINYKTPLFGDYGGMGRGRMDNLITAGHGSWGFELSRGFSISNAIKGNVMDGLSQMLSYQSVCITDTSAATTDEFENLELDENMKTKGDDHAIDAARYAFTYLNRIL